jgi:hypothetical protein
MVVCGKQAFITDSRRTVFILPDFSRIRKIKQRKYKIEYGVTRKGECMSKGHDVKKDVRKKAQRTLKEKRLAKKAKREGHYA